MKIWDIVEVGSVRMKGDDVRSGWVGWRFNSVKGSGDAILDSSTWSKEN